MNGGATLHQHHSRGAAGLPVPPLAAPTSASATSQQKRKKGRKVSVEVREAPHSHLSHAILPHPPCPPQGAHGGVQHPSGGGDCEGSVLPKAEPTVSVVSKEMMHMSAHTAGRTLSSASSLSVDQLTAAPVNSAGSGVCVRVYA